MERQALKDAEIHSKAKDPEERFRCVERWPVRG
jgi:hypothetical protein